MFDRRVPPAAGLTRSHPLQGSANRYQQRFDLIPAHDELPIRGWECE